MSPRRMRKICFWASTVERCLCVCVFVWGFVAVCVLAVLTYKMSASQFWLGLPKNECVITIFRNVDPHIWSFFFVILSCSPPLILLLSPPLLPSLPTYHPPPHFHIFTIFLLPLTSPTTFLLPSSFTVFYLFFSSHVPVSSIKEKIWINK